MLRDLRIRHIVHPEVFFLDHALWWNGPDWLHQDASQWPKRCNIPSPDNSDEECELCLHVLTNISSPSLPIFTRLKRVTSWIFRFIYNCRSRNLQGEPISESYLTIEELHKAEVYDEVNITNKNFRPTCSTDSFF